MNFWDTVKRYAFTFIGAMIMEPKNGGQGISLGRVCFLTVLGIMGLRWLGGLEALDSLLSVFLMEWASCIEFVCTFEKLGATMWH